MGSIFHQHCALKLSNFNMNGSQRDHWNFQGSTIPNGPNEKSGAFCFHLHTRTNVGTHTLHTWAHHGYTHALFLRLYILTPKHHTYILSLILSYVHFLFSFSLTTLFTYTWCGAFPFVSLFHLAFTLSEFFCLSLLLFFSVLKSDCFLKLGLQNVKTKL